MTNVIANLPPVSNPNPTTTFFNNYASSLPSVTSNTNDAIVSYFEILTGDPTSAKVLASAVIQTSFQQGLDPLETLNQFKKMKPGDLNAYLVLFLNLNRASTSLLGINNNTQSSPYTVRTILA